MDRRCQKITQQITPAGRRRDARSSPGTLRGERRAHFLSGGCRSSIGMYGTS
jgi:hypothetical protein